MQLRITTVILFVQDVHKLKFFYTSHFQLEVVEEISAEWVLLQAGSCQIGLHKIGKEYVIAAEKDFTAGGNTKIVFETDGDIEQLRAKLLEANITMREIKTFPGYDYWICDGEDPEGNVFQLKQRMHG